MGEELSETRAKVAHMIQKPEEFLKVQDEAFESAKAVTKVIYDFAKANEDASNRFALDTLPELIIEAFDEEQVWAGVELQNKAKFEILLTKVNKLTRQKEGMNLLLGVPSSCQKGKQDTGTKKVCFEDEGVAFGEDDDEDDDSEAVEAEEMEDEEDASEDEDEEDLDEKDSIFNDPDFQHMSDSDGDDLPPIFENAESEEEDSDDGASADEELARKADIDTKADAYMENVMKSLRSHREGHQVEDQFFKLDEMEKFLEKEDANEERRRLRAEKGMEVDSGEEDDLNLFGETDDNIDEEQARYKDYFDNVGSAPVRASYDEDKSNSRTSTPGDLLAESDEDKDLGEMKSTFEETQLRLKKKIKKMEEDAVREKPWQLSGEIAGPARPENSLLQEHLDYDSVAKMAPIITEAVSKRLEEIIVQRIKDKAWDDVERKIKPLEDPYEYKKKLVLDHEKSKLSLAQIYEQEFLQQQSKLEDGQKVQSILDKDESEVPKEVDAIQLDMKKLFAKLDTLTHFHYTPKSLSTEVKIIRNMPSIAMEEVAPVGASDATLLAPQEVLNVKKGELIGSSEKTETDKKRERRKKKSTQRAVQNEKDKKRKLVDKLNPGLGNKHSKKRMMADIKAAEKNGHLTTVKDQGKSKLVKSSAAFFNELQSETLSHVKEKSLQGGKRNKAVRAGNLKL